MSLYRRSSSGVEPFVGVWPVAAACKYADGGIFFTGAGDWFYYSDAALKNFRLGNFNFTRGFPTLAVASRNRVNPCCQNFGNLSGFAVIPQIGVATVAAADNNRS